MKEIDSFVSKATKKIIARINEAEKKRIIKAFKRIMNNYSIRYYIEDLGKEVFIPAYQLNADEMFEDMYKYLKRMKPIKVKVK